MSPEENRDRTRTQGGSSVKQTAYEATSRGSGVNPKNPTQDGRRLPVFKSFVEQERDWANHYLNLSANKRILTEHPTSSNTTTSCRVRTGYDNGALYDWPTVGLAFIR